MTSEKDSDGEDDGDEEEKRPDIETVSALADAQHQDFEDTEDEDE